MPKYSRLLIRVQRWSRSDFVLEKQIGTGAFGSVHLVCAQLFSLLPLCYSLPAVKLCLAGLHFEPSCCLVACGQFFRPVTHTKQVFASGVVAVDFSLDSTVTCSHAGVPLLLRDQTHSSRVFCAIQSPILFALARLSLFTF